MAIKLVTISQLYDKDIFASPGKNINIRSNPSTNSKLLLTVPGGERIGTVITHATGRDAKGNPDGSIWLQLKERYSNPSGFGAWVKFMPDIFEWKKLKEQGVKTVEQVIKEEEKKKKESEKTALDKISSTLITLGFIFLGVKAIDSRGRKNK